MSSDNNDNEFQPMPQHLYQEWTLEQDQLLWEHKNMATHELAALLGRGLHGVQARLQKLSNVDSAAYQRLFVNNSNNNPKEDDTETNHNHKSKPKLVPVSEVLRRIQWDPRLQDCKGDFYILHYDRVDDTIVESPLDAPNTSIQGSATSLIDALPEHRIVGVKYKDRLVWDRATRLDLVFSHNNEGEGIYHILDTYDDWKAQQDAALEWNRQRQAQVSNRIHDYLGEERYDEFKRISKELLKEEQTKTQKTTTTTTPVVERYVQNSLALFRQARHDDNNQDDGDDSLDNDFMALELLSELVALLPDGALRPCILKELSIQMSKLPSGSTNNNHPEQQSSTKTKKNMLKNRSLPELDEADLDESFVRGSGAGGQKINKTSNRVVLIHTPTSLKVECQDTRSLSQNRKLARKRLRQKLDDYLHGTLSKASLQTQRTVSKKQKTKAKNRARQRKKQLLKQQQQQQEEEQ